LIAQERVKEKRKVAIAPERVELPSSSEFEVRVCQPAADGRDPGPRCTVIMRWTRTGSRQAIDSFLITIRAMPKKKPVAVEIVPSPIDNLTLGDLRTYLKFLRTNLRDEDRVKDHFTWNEVGGKNGNPPSVIAKVDQALDRRPYRSSKVGQDVVLTKYRAIVSEVDQLLQYAHRLRPGWTAVPEHELIRVATHPSIVNYLHREVFRRFFHGLTGGAVAFSITTGDVPTPQIVDRIESEECDVAVVHTSPAALQYVASNSAVPEVFGHGRVHEHLLPYAWREPGLLFSTANDHPVNKGLVDFVERKRGVDLWEVLTDSESFGILALPTPIGTGTHDDRVLDACNSLFGSDRVYMNGRPVREYMHRVCMPTYRSVRIMVRSNLPGCVGLSTPPEGERQASAPGRTPSDSQFHNGSYGVDPGFSNCGLGFIPLSHLVEAVKSASKDGKIKVEDKKVRELFGLDSVAGQTRIEDVGSISYSVYVLEGYAKRSPGLDRFVRCIKEVCSDRSHPYQGGAGNPNQSLSFDNDSLLHSLHV
jgi:hypothetical protein